MKERGMGFFSALGLAFIILKLIKMISWSWIWVLSPFWIPVALVASVFLIMFIFALVLK